MHEGLADAINQIISTSRVTQHPKHSRSHWPPLTLFCLEKDVQMREETCLMVELVDSLNKFLLGHIKLSSMPSLKLSEGKLVQVESVTHKTRHLSRCLRVRSPLPGCCTRSQYRALLISIAAKRGAQPAYYDARRSSEGMYGLEIARNHCKQASRCEARPRKMTLMVR